MAQTARAMRNGEAPADRISALPAVFCWTKMGTEAGQPLEDIVRRKELEREVGGGLFAWGIGNSVGPAIKHARYAERIAALDTLFTPMRAAAKPIDAAPASVVLWLGYQAETGSIEPLADHMLVTSRGHSETGEEKRAHYALICRSHSSLLAQAGRWALDHRAVRNLVSANPVGASQVTAVVRYRDTDAADPAYPVLFRATLVDAAFVRLALPVTLTGDAFAQYQVVCASRCASQWRERLSALKAMVRTSKRMQAALF